MSTSAAKAPSGKAAAWLVLAMLANGFLVSQFWNRYWYGPDEGNYAHVAEQILDGAVLNRDVQDVHFGSVNFLHAGAMSLFGRRMVSLRIPLMAATLAQALLVFLIFRHRGGGLAALASIAVTILGVLQFLNPSAHWYSEMLLFALVFALERLSLGWRWRFEALGLVVGVLVGFRQLTGVLVAIGLVAWLLVERQAEEIEEIAEPTRRPWLAWVVVGVMGLGLCGYLSARADLAGFMLLGLWPLLVLAWTAARTAKPNGDTARMLLRLSLGGLIAVAPILLYHLAHGSWASWYHDVVRSATALSGLPFIHRQNLISVLFVNGIEVAAQAESLTTVVNGLFWAVLPFFPPLAGAALMLSLRRRTEPPPPLPFLAPFFAVVTLHYQNSTYLFFTLGVTLCGLLWLAQETSPGRARLVGGTIAMLSAIALYFHAGQSINRGDEGLFRGVRTPVKEAPTLPKSGLWIDKYDIAAYTLALRAIEREVGPQETFFALPSNTELYFLSDRPNPFRFFNFSIGVLTMAEVEAVDQELLRRPPKLVFFSPDDKYNTELSRELMRRVAGRYPLWTRIGYWDVYRRPDPPPTP